MDYLQATSVIMPFLWVLSTAVVDGEMIFRIDPLALLSATLRTYQKAACDSEQVFIACPRGTSISIEFAQYNKFVAKDGYSIEDLCPVSGEKGPQVRGKEKHLLRGSIFGSLQQKEASQRIFSDEYGSVFTMPPISKDVTTNSTHSKVAENGTTGDLQTYENNENTPISCMWPNALQYSLLQTVVDACQKKKHCKFYGSSQYSDLGASGVGDSSGTSSYHSSTVSTNSLTSDPCPKFRKIVEIAYKCRPYEFRSKVACHNDVAQLECNPYSRIAIYSASFGRTEYESIQCPQPQGVREETCLASYSTETVMQICHGRRRCNLAADANTFGTPCQKNSRMYLKVVYTCVPMQVLKEHDASETEADESEDFEGDINDLYDDELNYKESEAIPKLYSNTTGSGTRNSTGGSISRTSVTLSSNQTRTNSSLVADIDTVLTHTADFSLEDDQERLYIYLLIMGSLGVLLSIMIVAIRSLFQKRHGVPTDTHLNSSKKANGVAGVLAEETIIPSGFNDTISEIDADIDLESSVPLPIVSENENYLSFAATSSLFANPPVHLSSVSNPGSVPGFTPAPLLVGAHQSPDLIGIPPNAYVATGIGNRQTAVTGIMGPTIVIASNASGVPPPGSSAISTMVPITSLAQYTTAPTVRGGYIVNAGSIGVLQHPRSTPTPPNSLNGGSSAFPTTQPVPSPLAINPISHGLTVNGNSTLCRTKPLLQLSYDGTAPRTLSTGVSGSSQFFYG